MPTATVGIYSCGFTKSVQWGLGAGGEEELQLQSQEVQDLGATATHLQNE